MKYYVIFQWDKDATVYAFSAEKLIEWLADTGYEFLTESDVLAMSNPAMWGDNAILIIKGEAIVPEPEERVTRYKL